jgi:hypothetical protein
LLLIGETINEWGPAGFSSSVTLFVVAIFSESFEPHLKIAGSRRQITQACQGRGSAEGLPLDKN